MEIFSIIKELYTNKNSSWIIDMESKDIEPFVIQHFLIMNDKIRVQVRWLDKYVFTLPSKMWLSLAWSVLPKYDKQPFIPFIKTEKEEEEFEFILSLIRKHFNIKGNDYNTNKNRLISYIKKDMPNWFKYFGIEKRYWKQYFLDYNKMKESNVNVKQTGIGLSRWGL